MDSHQHDSGSSSEGFCENETLALEKPLLPSSPLTSSSSAKLAVIAPFIPSSISSNSTPLNASRPLPPPSLPLPTSAHQISGLDLPAPLPHASSSSSAVAISASVDTKDSPSGGSLGFGLSPQPPVDSPSTTSYDESDSPSGEKVSTQSPTPAGATSGLHHHKGALSEKKVSTPSVDELDSDWSDYPGNGEFCL